MKTKQLIEICAEGKATHGPRHVKSACLPFWSQKHKRKCPDLPGSCCQDDMVQSSVAQQNLCVFTRVLEEQKPTWGIQEEALGTWQCWGQLEYQQGNPDYAYK